MKQVLLVRLTDAKPLIRDAHAYGVDPVFDAQLDVTANGALFDRVAM